MIICPSGSNGTTIGNGVAEMCPTPESIARYFTELIVNGNLIIPPQKPPKKHIVKVTHEVTLRDIEILTVTLPDGTVAGNKIIVSGTLKLHIQYVADVLDQKVHYVHYDLPFNAIVVGDCGGLIPVTDPIFPNNFVVHVCVEKLHITQINNRTLAKEIVLMVWVEENI